MHSNQRHPATPTTDAVLLVKRGKKRGSYSCGRCGLPKKGHVCDFSKVDEDNHDPICPQGVDSSTITADASASVAVSMNLADKSPLCVSRSTLAPLTRRRALSFDDVSVDGSPDESETDWMVDLDSDGSGKLPMSCMWEVFRRLPPADLMSAAMVCGWWRENVRRVWRVAEELRLRVPASAHVGFIGSVLQKCPGLVKLTLKMERDFDATMLACIAFSCPNLRSMEISIADTSVNRISGVELSRFIAEKRWLTSLKMEGCYNLGSVIFSSSSLSTLWLSDLHSLSNTVFNFPNLKEVSLDFSRQENDGTDLTAVMDALGRSCPKLQNIHIASARLSHTAVLALTAANLRALRMLSLVLGTGITDASVAAIASSYSKLELLDLSGSSISDSGLGMICNVFPETLSKLLLALCNKITSSGIQFAAAQLPRLELMDCGMTICDLNSDDCTDENDLGCETLATPHKLHHPLYQKLIIKHARLKKLSLWGCSGLDALHLNCPRLDDLNLNSCRNLHPERLLLQCPDLETVHALDCQDLLVKSIENQVSSSSLSMFPSKRLPDGSKRIQLPYFFSPQPLEDEKKRRRAGKQPCAVVVT